MKYFYYFGCFGHALIVLSVFSVIFVTSVPLHTVRIVGGRTSLPGQFPYQALLLSFDGTQTRSVCGGCLISDRWIVTAAHCAEYAVNIEVHLGAQTFDNLTEIGRIMIKGKQKIIHHSYNSITGENDLALIQLETRVKLSATIQPVLLPSNINNAYTGQTAMASGWGIMNTAKPSAAKFLQYTPLQIITNAECIRSYSSSIVRSTTMCAKGQRTESVCNGDSGGPLVLESDRRTLVGVTSFGHNAGCHLGIPQGFSRVTTYLKWILEKTSNLSS